MASGWYYTQGGTRHGPVTSRELADLARAGQLRPDDHVWKDGMAEWHPARRVKGLFPEGIPAPPPPPPARPTAPEMGELLGLDLAGMVSRIRDAAASATRRAEAAVSGVQKLTGATAEPAAPTKPADPSAAGPPRPAYGDPAPPPVDAGGETADLLARVERLLRRVYDTAVPTTGLDAELAGLRRAVEARQAHLSRQQESADRDRQEGRRNLDALREAVRLATAARDARRAGRAAEADRLDAEAERARTGVPRLSEAERQAAADRLRERLGVLRGEGEVLAEALKLLWDAADGVENRRRIEGLTNGQPAAATPPAPGPHPASGFGAWYGRAFGLLNAVPPAVSWPLHAGLWTLGLGFMWVPVLYLAGKGLSCPACGRLWVRETEAEHLLARRQGFGRVVREDSHYNRDGRYTGSTRRAEQVVVNNDVVRVHYACKGCGHRWAEVEGRTSEA